MSEDDALIEALTDLRRAPELAGAARARLENRALRTLTDILRPHVARVLGPNTPLEGDSDPEDVLQKILMKLWRGECAAESGAEVLAFARRLAANARIDAARAARRRRTRREAETPAERDPELARVPGGVSPERDLEGRRQLEALEFLCARVLDAAGKKRTRTEVFVRAAVSGQYDVPERVGLAEKREATRRYQQRYKGRLYFRQIAATLDLSDEERALVDKLTARGDGAREDGGP